MVIARLAVPRCYRVILVWRVSRLSWRVALFVTRLWYLLQCFNSERATKASPGVSGDSLALMNLPETELDEDLKHSRLNEFICRHCSFKLRGTSWIQRLGL